MSVNVYDAIVLKNINYKDNDKLYTLFTRQIGKITANAKGVRRISSKRAGSLDSISKVKVGIFEGQGGKRTITEVESVKSFSKIKNSPEKTSKAFYLAELVLKHTEDEYQNPYLYDLFVRTLDLIDDNDLGSEVYLALFQIFFIQNLGFDLNFSKCSNCFKPFSEFTNFYMSNELGGFVCGDCYKDSFNFDKFPISLEIARFLNAARSSPKAMPKFDPHVIHASNEILKNYIKSIFEKELTSENLL